MTVSQAHQHIIKVLSARLPQVERKEIHTRARLLLDWIAELSHAHLLASTKVLSAEAIEVLEHAIEEAAHGRPLPYITGRREFFGLDFFVDERVLIPRPETELLVETVLEHAQAIATPLLADLGTGSGCIAVSLAHTLPTSRVIATDASNSALEVAQQNARQNDVAERMDFLPGQIGNWATPLQHFAGQFDAIASNPPYISLADVQQLQPEILHFEPHSALAAGADGLDCYRELAAQIPTLLKPGGLFAAELGAGQFEAVKSLFENQGWKVEAPRLDFAGIERVLLAKRMAADFMHWS